MKVSRKNWIKTVGLSVAGLLTLKSVKTSNGAKPKAKFEYSIRTQCTRDILIPLEDGKYALNTYCEFAKYIAECHSNQLPFVHKRYESDIIEVKDISIATWNEFESKCRADFELTGPMLKPNFGVIAPTKIV